MEIDKEFKDSDSAIQTTDNMAQNVSTLSADDSVPVQEIVTFVVQGVLITCACILGILANIICVFVMSRPALKKGQCASVNALLLSMAVVDLIVVVCR